MEKSARYFFCLCPSPCMLRFLWCAFWGMLLGTTALCRAAPSPPQLSPSPPQPVIQHQSLEKVRLTLATDRQTVGIADPLILRLTVETPLDTVVVFPPVTDKLGPFRVLRHQPSGPVTSAPHTQQWKQDYTLEAEEVGEHTIPPLTITFQDADTSVPQQLKTDPLTIHVTSVLPDDADVTAPQDIAPPVALVRRGVPPGVWIVVGVLLGLGLIGSLWYLYQRRRRRTAAPVPAQPAHVLALQALQRLQREDLITLQRLEEFYVRLSDILRRYVERRFGLRAPEQTTEEFLAAVLATGGLIATHGDLLATFLQHCDLVKFARHQPSSSDMQRALDSARDFVEQTAETQAVVPASASGVEA